MYDGVMAKMKESSVLQQRIFKSALASSRKRNELLEAGKKPGMWLDFQYKFFDRLMFSKIRDRLGGRILYVVRYQFY